MLAAVQRQNDQIVPLLAITGEAVLPTRLSLEHLQAESPCLFLLSMKGMHSAC